MKNLKICYLALALAFACTDVACNVSEPMEKIKKRNRTDVACNVSTQTMRTDVACNVSYASGIYTLPAQPIAVPYSTSEKPITATKFAIADAAVVIDATSGIIDLAATMAQQPIPAGTSRQATVQYLDNGLPGNLPVTIYRYLRVEDIPAELIDQISGAGGRMETDPPKQRDVSPIMIIVSG